MAFTTFRLIADGIFSGETKRASSTTLSTLKNQIGFWLRNEKNINLPFELRDISGNLIDEKKWDDIPAKERPREVNIITIITPEEKERRAKIAAILPRITLPPPPPTTGVISRPLPTPTIAVVPTPTPTIAPTPTTTATPTPTIPLGAIGIAGALTGPLLLLSGETKVSAPGFTRVRIFGMPIGPPTERMTESTPLPASMLLIPKKFLIPPVPTFPQYTAPPRFVQREVIPTAPTVTTPATPTTPITPITPLPTTIPVIPSVGRPSLTEEDKANLAKFISIQDNAFKNIINKPGFAFPEIMLSWEPYVFPMSYLANMAVQYPNLRTKHLFIKDSVLQALINDLVWFTKYIESGQLLIKDLREGKVDISKIHALRRIEMFIRSLGSVVKALEKNPNLLANDSYIAPLCELLHNVGNYIYGGGIIRILYVLTRESDANAISKELATLVRPGDITGSSSSSTGNVGIFYPDRCSRFGIGRSSLSSVPPSSSTSAART